MSFLNIVIERIRTYFPKDKVNKFSIIVILIYYYIGLLSYITVPIRPIYHFFTSGSSVAVVIRAAMTAMLILYSLLVVFVNEEKIQWKWAVVFVYILLFTLISTIISPQTYNYVYISSGNYGVIYWVQASTGFNRLFTMYLSSISDFALAFCFLFILPIVINNRKQMLILLFPIVLIGLAECGYSLIKEKEEYIKLINFTDPQFGGYNIVIGASFGNKQDWGAFATVAFTCSIVSFFFFEGTHWRVILTKVFLIIASIIIFGFTVASLCKTAIFSELLIYVSILLYFDYYLIKKRILITILIYNTFIVVFFVAIILFYNVPSFHSTGILEKLYKVTYNFIIARVEGGAAGGRTIIWMRLIENFRTYNLFFGLSKGGVSTYSQIVSVEGQSSVHNGIAYFFASYGLFGFTVYMILFALVICRIIKLWKINSSYIFVLIGVFGAALIFSLVEAEVLIVSGSNPIFVFNVLLCVLPQGLILKNRIDKEETSNEMQYA